VRRTVTDEVQVVGTMTASDLRGWLDGLPDEARVSVSVTAGDRPWESETTYLRATFERGEK
jgi:hypothetical protein